TRKGGVSPHPWTTLNLGGTVGDDRANVVENRRRIYQVMNREVESIFDVWQVHSADVICTDTPRPLDALHSKGDAILTNNPEITLFMRFADCVPILLYDPVRRVIGVVHAGWQGTVKKVVQRSVIKMTQQYGSMTGDIYAGIGPSIGPDHYQIGDDVIQQVRAGFGRDAPKVLLQNNGSTHLDLWRANAILLEQAGVKHIEIANLCTACDTERWYSHRAEQGKTGRFGAIIALAS
ncbi:peptidoglycan editing factor PgeF, partial [bacterium]|nr:peptidoglycan editing factor PgeF [bacterium]